MHGIAEGVKTVVVARKLAQKLKVDMPITEQVHAVLYEGISVIQAMRNLMQRELKHELRDYDTYVPKSPIS
jgi:glycerol-3-phosphate dehydrogenase (NAD(P)+)